MRIVNAARSAWMGLVFGALAGAAAGADTPGDQTEAAPTTVEAAEAPKAVRAVKGDSAGPIMKREETPEVKARRQKHARDLKAIQATADKMSEDFVETVRERQKARRAKEKAGKTPEAASAKGPAAATPVE